MNRAVHKITVAGEGHRYFRAGDIVRVTETAEMIVITSARGGGPRYWEPIPFREVVWSWLRRRGWKRTRVTEWYRPIIRGYRHRPSPLPRRLP